jgi:hypothetical protein
MAERGEREKQGGDRAKSQATTLLNLGLDKHESQRFREVAAVPAEIFEGHLAESRVNGIPVSSAGVRALNHRAQGTGEVEWYTPSIYIEAARDVLGA